LAVSRPEKPVIAEMSTVTPPTLNVDTDVSEPSGANVMAPGVVVAVPSSAARSQPAAVLVKSSDSSRELPRESNTSTVRCRTVPVAADESRLPS